MYLWIPTIFWQILTLLNSLIFVNTSTFVYVYSSILLYLLDALDPFDPFEVFEAAEFGLSNIFGINIFKNLLIFSLESFPSFSSFPSFPSLAVLLKMSYGLNSGSFSFFFFFLFGLSSYDPDYSSTGIKFPHFFWISYF